MVILEEHEITNELPLRDGYVFVGWSRTQSSDNEGTPEYMILPPEASNTEGNRQARVIKTVQSDITLYAIWREIVEIEVQDHELRPVDRITTRIGAIENVSPINLQSSPHRTHFYGWNVIDASGNVTPTFISRYIFPEMPRRLLDVDIYVTSPLTLIPIFLEIEDTITFDSNGLVWVHAGIPVVIERDYIVMNPEAMYRTGIPFIGWRTPEAEIIEQLSDTHFVSVEELLDGENQIILTGVWGEFIPRLTFPSVAVGCAQTDESNPTNIFTDTTGFQWCAVREQTIDGNTYVMLVSRYTLQMRGVNGVDSNQVHHNNTHMRWPATTHVALPTLAGTQQDLGPAGRTRVHTWWNGQHAGTANHVSAELRTQAVHANIPRSDNANNNTMAPGHANTRPNNANHLSTPIPNTMGASTPVFFLNEAEVHQLISNQPAGRVGNRIDTDTLEDSGTATRYWLRSIGGGEIMVVQVDANGNWGARSAGFATIFGVDNNSFRPAIWVYAGNLEN